MPISAANRHDPRLVRVDDSWLRLPNPYDVPVEICAGPDVPIEPVAVDELLTVLETAETLDTLARAVPGLDPDSARACSARGCRDCSPTAYRPTRWAPGGRSGRTISPGWTAGCTILPIALDERSAAARRRYLTAFGNAANFALGNRFFLALMLRTGLAEVAGELRSRLVYDAPHNLLWPEPDGTVLHRKGATPAAGAGGAGQRPTGLYGEPVIVPGSMGAPSYLLRGLGSTRALTSACHGAGRSIPRGAASRGGDAELDAFLREFRVVTPVDHRDPAVAARRDIVDAWRRDLKQEAPWTYKEVGPVVRSLRRAGVAEPVAELRPLLTVKG